MERANIMLSLAGDRGNTLPKYSVTPAEIAVLRAIHGPESVHDVERVEDDKDADNRSELARLRGIYGGATDGNLGKIVDKLFPGAGARVMEKLSELDLPDEFYKATTRAKGDKPKKAMDTPVTRANTARRDEDGIGDL